MVAKISRNPSLFAVLKYNHLKIEKQTGRIISGNRMITDMTNNPQNLMQQAILSFENYLAANQRTENPILHISLNPSPEDRLADEQFAALADDYMEKMGYADQPYIVYMHEDIGRRHIHIVTTCVDEHGRKIDDSFEWRRSVQASRELELKYGLKQVGDKKNELTGAYLNKIDPKRGEVKQQMSNILKSVLGAYKFQSFGEYCALLSCFNIEAQILRGQFEGETYTGIVYKAIDDKGKQIGPAFKSSLFGKQFGHEGLTKKMNRHAASYKQRKWGPKIQDDIRQAMIACGGKHKKFEKFVRNRGLDVVFRRNDEGRIYGVTFIDHRSREVYNGSRLGKEFSANSFEGLFNGHPFPNLGKAPERNAVQTVATDKESILEQIFGLFPADPHYDDFIPEDELIPRRKRKKKKRTQSLS